MKSCDRRVRLPTMKNLMCCSKTGKAAARWQGRREPGAEWALLEGMLRADEFGQTCVPVVNNDTLCCIVSIGCDGSAKQTVRKGLGGALERRVVTDAFWCLAMMKDTLRSAVRSKRGETQEKPGICVAR